MKRVAIISVNGVANLGGVERVVADHQRILTRYFAVRVISLPNGPLLRRVRRVRLIDLLMKVLFPAVSSIIARLWAGPRGLVISHGYSSAGYFCDLTFGHGCWAGYMRNLEARPGPFSRFVLLYEKSAARRSRKVVLVSHRVLEQWVLHYGLDRNKAQILPNSVDTSVFHPLENDGRLPSCAAFKVLFVGSFVKGKGSAYLTRLYSEIVSSGDTVSVSICSPLPVPEEVRRSLPGFRFIHGLDDKSLAREYNNADLFLLPSLYEAFEMSSLEALACGTPVLLNDTGARPQLEALNCPGVFRLENAESPRAAIWDAFRKFSALQRESLAAWTQERFGTHTAEKRFLEICGCGETAGRSDSRRGNRWGF